MPNVCSLSPITTHWSQQVEVSGWTVHEAQPICAPVSFSEAAGGMLLGCLEYKLHSGLRCDLLLSLCFIRTIFSLTRGVFLFCIFLLNPWLKARCCVFTHMHLPLGLEIKLQMSPRRISVYSEKWAPSCKTYSVLLPDSTGNDSAITFGDRGLWGWQGFIFHLKTRHFSDAETALRGCYIIT